MEGLRSRREPFGRGVATPGGRSGSVRYDRADAEARAQRPTAR